MQFIVDACAEITLETGRSIDHQNCDQVEASCIADLAALYCLTYPTGGCECVRGYTFSQPVHIVALMLNLVIHCFRFQAVRFGHTSGGLKNLEKFFCL
jgi:hypothetical protein